jgi:hypothetical protein
VTDRWLKMGRLKEKENTKLDQLHDNKATDRATSTSSIKDNLQKKCKYDDSSNSDLRVLVIPVQLMPTVYYVTKLQETVPWFP